MAESLDLIRKQPWFNSETDKDVYMWVKHRNLLRTCELDPMYVAHIICDKFPDYLEDKRKVELCLKNK